MTYRNRLRAILIFCLCGIAWTWSVPGYSQEQPPPEDEVKATSLDCAQRLRLARATYEQGRLHELEAILTEGNCLGLKELTKEELRDQKKDDKKKSGGLDVQQRIEGLRLLTLSYIYLEEPLKADETMLKLLAADHFYEPNPLIDPAEYISLYNTFRTDPIFNLGFRFGVSYTMPGSLENLTVAPNAETTDSKYLPQFNIQLGGAFEKKLFGRFSMAPELQFSVNSYKDTDPEVLPDPGNGIFAQLTSMTFTESRLGANLLMQFSLAKDNTNKSTRFLPWIAAGPALQYLISAKAAGLIPFNNGQASQGADVDIKKNLYPLHYGFIVAGGVKYRMGSIYVLGDIRYQLGLRNVVDPANRSNDELLWDYLYVLKDHLINPIQINIGVVYPYFKPQKKRMLK